jgi:hypothetical protein
MKKEILIKNNSSITTIIIKSNYIESYLNLLSKKNKKVFCIVDNKLKIYFLKKIKNINFNTIFIKIW